jgi:hypothetical protein
MGAILMSYCGKLTREREWEGFGVTINKGGGHGQNTIFFLSTQT